jgi:hypothetical protein
MDRPLQAMAALARLFSESDRDNFNTRLRVWRGPPPQDLARNTTMLTHLCMLADADTCIVDSLKDAALELSKEEGGAGSNQACQLAIEAGTRHKCVISRPGMPHSPPGHGRGMRARAAGKGVR